jgi:ribosomal protein S18 acetylase RimI-like enzyme
MLFEAFFWTTEISRPNLEEFFKNREIDKLISDWGRPGDRTVVAEIDRKPVGAAWFRLWTESNHSYGFIHPDIPELGMAIVPEYRSRGFGRRLLKKLIDLAREDGYVALSLSVDPANFARKLYESEGFVKVGESGTSWTYKLEL